MDINQASLQMHYDLHGKIEVISRKKIEHPHNPGFRVRSGTTRLRRPLLL